jgi:DNA-binding Lrp family transcriptional regulator
MAEGSCLVKRGIGKEIDQVDLRLLSLLQEDSRLSIRRLGESLKISAPTAYHHIRRLEAMGTIEGYTIVVDPVKIGYDLTTVILIQVDGKHILEVENEIAKMSYVISVYDVTGNFDIAVISRSRDVADLNAFINNLFTMPYVIRTVTNIALNIIKENYSVCLAFSSDL